MTDHSLTLSPSILEMMRHHVNAEAPLEACGLVGGLNGEAKIVLPVKNATGSSTRFQMEPRAQLRAIEQIESEGLEIVAIFHSHPRGPTVPSPTDIAEVTYKVVSIIWSRVGRRWQARGFWIENGHAAEVPLNVQKV
jgi:proteasome lid subunit RPN8/RPN11